MAIRWEVSEYGQRLGVVEGSSRTAAREVATRQWPGRELEVVSEVEATILLEEQSSMKHGRSQPGFERHIEHGRKSRWV